MCTYFPLCCIYAILWKNYKILQRFYSYIICKHLWDPTHLMETTYGFKRLMENAKHIWDFYENELGLGFLLFTRGQKKVYAWVFVQCRKIVFYMP